MTIAQLLQIVLARWKLICAVFFAIVLSTLAASLLLPKIYVAEVSLVIDPRTTDPISGAAQEQTLASFLATEIDVISSHNVALKVVDKLNLTAIPDVARQFRSQTGGRGSIRDWLADSLRQNLEVKPARISSVVSINFYGEDPRFVVELANAFAEAYIQTNLELRTDPAKRQTGWFEQQVQGLRQDLEAAQKRLSDYQRESGIAGADSRLDVESARLAEISSQQVAAQGAVADALTRLRQIDQARANQHLSQLPDVLGNSLLQSMKADLVRAQGKLADVGQRYDRNHPLYRSASAEVAELGAKLESELATAIGSIRQNAQIAQSRAAELQRSVDQQKARILELKNGRDSLDVLMRDVENAQRTYDAGVQRFAAVGLEGKLDESTIAILNPAVIPVDPVRPRLLLNILVATLVGGLLSLAAGILMEMFDRRVRSEEDLLDAADLVVLAVIPRLLLPAPRPA